MSRYYKAEDVIRKRAEDLADISYLEYGNTKNVGEWIEVAEMEFEDLPTIDAVEVVRCKDCREYEPYADFEGYGACRWYSNNIKRDDDFCSVPVYWTYEEAINDIIPDEEEKNETN